MNANALRLYHGSHLSQREISRSPKIGYGTVVNYLSRARNAGLSWPLPPDMDEQALELMLFPQSTKTDAQHKFIEPDFPALYLELKPVAMNKQLA